MSSRRVAHSPVVLVDGLNVARSRWPNLELESVVARARAWAEREGVDVVLVFDGRAPGGEPVARLDERTTVVGTGPGSADDWIAGEARRLAADGRSVWLASSDRGLRARVQAVVQRHVGGGSFLAQLDAFAE